MTHEKIYVREDKTKVKIFLRFSTEWYKDERNWEVQISILPPRKRNWQFIADPLNYKYRNKSCESRQALCEEEQLQYVTKQEIHQAKLELWEKLKPVEGI